MKTMMAFGALALTGGCVTDESELGEATQPLANVSVHTLSASAYDTLNLGEVVRGRACFLASVQGDISNGTTGTAGAGVDIGGGQWRLYVRPSSGTVMAKAVCMTGVSYTAEVSWTSGQANQILAPVLSNKKCFLTAIGTAIAPPYFHGGLHTDSDVVQIIHSGSNWVLGGTTNGTVTAKARCIGVNGNLDEVGVWAPAGQALNTPTLLTDEDAACMLTRVNGHFDASGTGLSMSHSVGLGSDHYWSLQAVNASGGARRCVD